MNYLARQKTKRSVEKSSLMKLTKHQFEIMNSKCNLNNTQFPCKICRLDANKNVEVIQSGYVNTGFRLNVITSTILTTNTLKVQMILGFVLPVPVLSFHLCL